MGYNTLHSSPFCMLQNLSSSQLESLIPFVFCSLLIYFALFLVALCTDYPVGHISLIGICNLLSWIYFRLNATYVRSIFIR